MKQLTFDDAQGRGWFGHPHGHREAALKGKQAGRSFQPEAARPVGKAHKCRNMSCINMTDPGKAFCAACLADRAAHRSAPDPGKKPKGMKLGSADYSDWVRKQPAYQTARNQAAKLIEEFDPDPIIMQILMSSWMAEAMDKKESDSYCDALAAYDAMIDKVMTSHEEGDGKYAPGRFYNPALFIPTYLRNDIPAEGSPLRRSFENHWGGPGATGPGMRFREYIKEEIQRDGQYWNDQASKLEAEAVEDERKGMPNHAKNDRKRAELARQNAHRGVEGLIPDDEPRAWLLSKTREYHQAWMKVMEPRQP